MEHQTFSSDAVTLEDDHWSPEDELFAEVVSLSTDDTLDDDIWD